MYYAIPTDPDLPQLGPYPLARWMTGDATLAFGQDGWKPSEVCDESRACVDPTGPGWAELVADNIAGNRAFRWNAGVAGERNAMIDAYVNRMGCTQREAQLAIDDARTRRAAKVTATTTQA